MSSPKQIRTNATEILGIRHPVLLAGIFNVASPKLAAAVTNGGGLGVIGGVAYTPDLLQEALNELKSNLVDKSALLTFSSLRSAVAPRRPSVYDYSHGKLRELLEIIIESGAKLREVGAELICAQGGEGGGHTGDILTIVLIPAVGTRFILSEEAGASRVHQTALQDARFATLYLRRWEEERKQEMQGLQSKGVMPLQHEHDTNHG
ncbi:hypothetical protein BDW59DRAFT_168728 [Aspergillus cavernicola]|uniref:Nitronate monooxygenase domain-containing protein n=1 Tax=Aspergillus cavernicola TaxID=176166 RepID=A0ABR4J4M2_9EURO